jgi:hypothetical protein
MSVQMIDRWSHPNLQPNSEQVVIEIRQINETEFKAKFEESLGIEPITDEQTQKFWVFRETLFLIALGF